MTYTEVILLKCGEIVLKGLNRRRFEQKLIENIRHQLSPIGNFAITSRQSTIYVRPKDEPSSGAIDAAFEAVQNVYGIAALCKAAECPKHTEDIFKLLPDYCKNALERAKTFRVNAKRSDKNFPLTSPELSAMAGGVVLKHFPHLSVDLHNPDVTVTIEIREAGAYLYADRLPGAGGMPVGSGGHAMLLLSGGIDSPVAGHMMAKRGVSLTALHFESPPYTSPRARQKVIDLATVMTKRCGSIRLFIVPVAKLQETLRDRCPSELFTVLFRRCMIRIACLLAEKEDIPALITGESLGQVASQTMEALNATQAVSDRVIFRPLIGMDKEEIVTVARQTETYEISIQPFEDCCTIFTPKHPKTKPRIDKLEQAEAGLDMDALCQEAISEMEAILLP
ncbi:MAG TPA: tRNA 4-thiouridine(8) synthase ThiI [Clostridiales bacterium]|nr:tRNA 4-thiouridine(8) synthase ThiI [Clostridiales bacterium]